tara:strand:- start:238 stop:468 length:231 start_codon:yes stop_codon:yes gene_type:complete
MKITKSQLKQIIAEEKERILEEAPRSNDDLLTLALTKLGRAEKASGYTDVQEYVEEAMALIAVVRRNLVLLNRNRS